MDTYIVTAWHGEGDSTFYVVDQTQPDDLQPAIVRSWNTRQYPDAYWRAVRYADRRNG